MKKWENKKNKFYKLTMIISIEKTRKESSSFFFFWKAKKSRIKCKEETPKTVPSEYTKSMQKKSKSLNQRGREHSFKRLKAH